MNDNQKPTQSVTIETPFPNLQKTEGNFHYSFYIGKESKPYLIAIAVIASLILLFLGANLALTWKKTSFDSRETRLIQQAIDEKRLENRQAWKELGIDGNALEDHDISDIMKQLQQKYPLEKTDEP